jgi:peptidoglycan-associated lipoprotein
MRNASKLIGGAAKLALVAALALVVTGCACRTNRIGPGENIGRATPGVEMADINFGFDLYNIDAKAQSILAANAQWLKDNPNKSVQIEGHTDERGTAEYNMALGARRARAAMEYLRALGIDASRMSTVSYGEELPLDPRSNEEAWAKNRRAHFNVQ